MKPVSGKRMCRLLESQGWYALMVDVFAVLVEKLPEFRYDQQLSFRAWLRAILMNKWRNRQRRPYSGSPLVGVARADRLPLRSA